MNINDEFEVKIETMSSLGLGIAKLDGQVVFVNNACPYDTAIIKITKINKNFLNADIVKIIKPSKYRTEKICPLQKVCGACQLGFIDYDYQLEIKHNIVKDAIKKIGHLDNEVNYPVKSPKIFHYRQKIQYPISQTQNSKRLIAGYYKPHTHDIVNIKYCPVHPEICDKIFEYIREKGNIYNISGYVEKTNKGCLKHVVIRLSEYSKKLLVTFVVNKIENNLKNLALYLYNNFDEISGVCINYNPKKTNVILSDNSECIAGQDYIEEKILDKIFKIGVNTFFQINPSSAENIFKYVKDEVSKFEKPVVLDAYAGIAAFGAVVSDAAKSVVSVEENPKSIELAQDVLKMNNINNIELYANDTLKYLKSVKRKFNISIIDPPRKGCEKEALDEILKHTKDEIIYISCNPATLARDLSYLKEKGCNVLSIQPFDMFCHTYHVETVAIVKI